MKSIVLLLIAVGLASSTHRFIDTAPADVYIDTAPADVGQRAVSDSSGVHIDLPTSSVYHVESKWTDQNGADMVWASLQGRYRLVAFFYTHCGYACPRIVHDLKGVLSGVPEDDRRAVGVVLVSIDPEHDTLEALQGYSTTHGLSRPQWTLLRGADTDVRELAAVLGVSYTQQPGGDFAHSNTIVLLDENGEIAARRDGSDSGIQPILGALTRLD